MESEFSEELDFYMDSRDFLGRIDDALHFNRNAKQLLRAIVSLCNGTLAHAGIDNLADADDDGAGIDGSNFYNTGGGVSSGEDSLPSPCNEERQASKFRQKRGDSAAEKKKAAPKKRANLATPAHFKRRVTSSKKLSL